MQCVHNSQYNILIVESKKLVADMFAYVIRSQWTEAFVIHVQTVSEALEQLQSTTAWDILLLDLNCSEKHSGIEVLKFINSTNNQHIRSVVISSKIYQPYAVQCLALGASAYLPKCVTLQEFLDALKAVSRGETHVPPAMAKELYYNTCTGQSPVPHKRLTRREFCIFSLLASGQSVSEVARQLELSPKTVSNHRLKILEKMNLSTNMALMRYALENGIITE